MLSFWHEMQPKKKEGGGKNNILNMHYTVGAQVNSLSFSFALGFPSKDIDVTLMHCLCMWIRMSTTG